jgi:hypothetical protein
MYMLICFCNGIQRTIIYNSEFHKIALALAYTIQCSKVYLWHWKIGKQIVKKRTI